MRLPLRHLVLVASIAFGAARVGAAAAEQRELARLSDVIRVRVVDRALTVEWVAPMQPPLRPITVKGPDAPWRVRAMREGPGGIELERPPARVPGEAPGYWHVSVSAAAPDRLVITGRRGGRTANDTTLRFTQAVGHGAGGAIGGGAAHLVVTDNVARTVAQAHAADLVELRAAHPRLVREFLVPLLRQLTGHDPLVPGAADVYAVFEELDFDDPRVARELSGLVGDLGHPSFARRESASARIAALAPQSVCALSRMTRDGLMPEQRVRIDALLADHSHRALPDPRAARRDVSFLADCLEFPGDERVRRAARAELEQLSGRAIPLHAVPTDEEWARAADVVRGWLSVSAHTQPPAPAK